MQQDVVSTSLEAVKYQGKSPFFLDLIGVFRQIQETRDFSTNGLIDTNIDAIIKRHTNMTVAIEALLDGMSYYNAYARPPIINHNSPFYAFMKSLGLSNHLQGARLNDRELKAHQKRLTFMIDKSKGKVYGVISKIPMRLGIGYGMMKEFTPEQSAAVVLHEVGHLFTFFEQIVDTTSSNMVIAIAADDLASTNDPVSRLQLIHQYERIVGQKLHDGRSLAEMKLPADGYAAVLIKDGVEHANRSASGTDVYDIRNSEFAADHFATMHGASKDLLLALERVYKLAGINVRESTSAWFRSECAKVIGVCTVTILAPVMPKVTKHVFTYMLGVMTSDYVEHRTYDLPKERLMRIRGNLVQVIKNLSLTGADREAVLEDIDMIDDLAKEMVDRRSFLNWFWISLKANRKKTYRQIEFQKELEAVVNNNLFVSAGKLNQLTAQGA